ncbi:pyruvate phosphate dikinase PEP/pyruvate-binding protein [Brasilonema octagenarum UFV-E1]|uniref:Pyruvate phosphate dikinase PEP/pyruvate-binding protein n=2 Tax=Brasilonema TaxID=383614 RepID=A0A856MQ87_9CYAN|nr:MULTISPECIES: glycerol-3-phosphate acyltransferase [Brasilonema]NMF66250.1 pyruvate phosphate dikinase PEP/pyruvate-binding protein [Brasilonema octagenarum UFV-OR1]QDL11186.1 pyruvate phosphate dikinase PEP/pyruvate-binding protein [Brasilonema sennae CENA114]QDL17531.1 pyruvate phosphate dikinase PEP/pyruvate-binding protein [Brasilonema octagenarum UFV-E1]
MLELWGFVVVFIVCPVLGALPIIAWLTQATTGRQLAQIGTGNISVSSAFYHGGTLVGILAVFSEAIKGIAAVLLARIFFGEGSAWELIALMGLVLGRFLAGKGAGTTNAVWGFGVHDPLAAVFVFLLAGVSFTIVRSRLLAKFGVLVLLPAIVAVLHPETPARILAAAALAGLLAWIYKQIPDDLNLPVEEAQSDSQAAFKFFRGNQSILTLDDELEAALVGQKAARLAEVKRWGYPVPKGWIIGPYQNPEQLIETLQPSPVLPFVVRSSAIGEDTELASGAGQYETVLNVTSKQELRDAIAQCRASYNSERAIQYRRDRTVTKPVVSKQDSPFQTNAAKSQKDFGQHTGESSITDAAMAVLIQQQVQGVYSGVAFTRDPITKQGDAIIIEALPGNATGVVSGRVTPEQYRAYVVETDNFTSIQLEGEGNIPPTLIKQVAYLSRHLEEHYHGIPQDIEWTYDGQTLWTLQTRPITTLLPIWTRKIAAEVIPGLIRPLTWSINRPLTCGVWGEIFALVLGKGSVGLDFNQTATLHYSRSYFNATLLGEIFRRMGLPPESLEFLTRGAKMSQPPIETTLRNFPGLVGLLLREFSLTLDFNRDNRKQFVPALSELASEPVENLEPARLWTRINLILELLRGATYYSILAPLSAALRQAIFRVKDGDIDNSRTPEVAALRAIQDLATTARQILPEFNPVTVFEQLRRTPEGQEILNKFDKLLEHYGYLSEVGTDIAVPTWKEESEAVKQLFVQLMQTNEPLKHQKRQRKKNRRFVQKRVHLKGRVTEVYSRLLAQLRWCFVALEQVWLKSGLLKQPGDIFFLELEEVRRLVESFEPAFVQQLQDLVELRRTQLAQDNQRNAVPVLVYGNNPPAFPLKTGIPSPNHVLQGIPASPGQAEGRVKVLRNLQSVGDIDRDVILVVPYTDSGWAPLLVRAGGLIAEAGGRLSHGAIIAREYGIPAIMDVTDAMSLLQDGQKVRIDGYKGIVEISDDLRFVE